MSVNEIDVDHELWSDGLPNLNVGNIALETQCLGPGLRSVVWVQGCCFNCSGCIAPRWIPNKLATLYDPKVLAELLLINPGVSGITYSGGEPMLQAGGLAELIVHARTFRDISLICYTGFSLDELNRNPPTPGVPALLNEIDVLIDGPFISSLNDNKGLRGSSNQSIHYITNRYTSVDFEKHPRNAEIRVDDGYAVLIGVPPINVSESLYEVIRGLKKFYKE